MEFIEKTLPGKPVDPAANDMGQMMMKVAKLPGFVVKWLFKKNIDKIREGMGGDPRDITTRPIGIEDKQIPGYEEDIRIRVYTPPGEGPMPVLFFYHGGGWIGGTVQAVEEYCKGVADQGGCTVISVDYHLAPEHPFPIGLEDSYCAIKWAAQHAAELQIDPARIAVGGDSAGGNFAAVLCFLANERREFTITKQILVYPATDLRLSSEESGPDDLPPKIANAFYSMYTNDPAVLASWRVSPATAPSFAGLPPALITVGDKDGLHQPSLAYAKKLDAAGVTVKFILYKGAFHAFIDDTGNSDQADDFVRETAAFIKGA
jgi:acetyl esterase